MVLSLGRTIRYVYWRSLSAVWRGWLRCVATEHVGRRAAGLELRAIQEEAPAQAIFDKLEKALAIIAEHDPRRFQRMRQDLDFITVTDFLIAAGASGLYMPGSRTCYLDTAWVESRGLADVALMIVHESAHARLDRLQPSKWPAIIERVEHRCLREELSFASMLPESRFPGIQQWRAIRESSRRYRTATRRRALSSMSGGAV